MNALEARSPDQNPMPPAGLAPVRSTYSFCTKDRSSTLGFLLCRSLSSVARSKLCALLCQRLACICTRYSVARSRCLALPKTCPYPYWVLSRPVSVRSPGPNSVPCSAKDFPVSVLGRPVRTPSHLTPPHWYPTYRLTNVPGATGVSFNRL